MLKQILSVPVLINAHLPFPFETGKSFAVRKMVSELEHKISPRWLKYIDSLTVDGKDNHASYFGTARRPLGLHDLYCHGIMSNHLKGHRKDSIKTNTQVVLYILSQVGDEAKAQSSLGNSAYLANYLIISMFLEIAENKDSEAAKMMFECGIKTHSRAFFLVARIVSFLMSEKCPSWLKERVNEIRSKKHIDERCVVEKEDFPEVYVSKVKLKSIPLRRIYLNIALKAFFSGKKYGLNNFQSAMSDYYDYAMKNYVLFIPERWNDKAHNEYAENAACCGIKGLFGTLRFYLSTLHDLKKSPAYYAWMAHSIFLLFFFKTTSTAILEALMTSYLDDEAVDCPLNQSTANEIIKQRDSWLNFNKLYNAMLKKDVEAIKKLESIDLVGQLSFWLDLKQYPDALNHLKKIVEEDISKHPNDAEKLYKYSYMLKSINDSEADKWYKNFTKIAPKRYEELVVFVE